MRYRRFRLLSAALAVALSGLGSSPLGAQTNEPPDFARSSYSFELPENLTSRAVGTVVATDPEGGPIIYRVKGGSNRFSIDAGGVVRYSGSGEDYELGKRVFGLRVEATDSGGLSASVPVRVKLQNVNEAPEFEKSTYTFGLDENRSGPFSLGTARATDPDGAVSLSYRLSGAVPRFAVSGQGALRYTGSGEDFESGTRPFSFRMTATDAGGLSGSVDVRVEVRDVNEAPTFERDSYEFALDENESGPLMVGTVLATDQDADGTLRYTLAGARSELFAVGSVGEVRYVGEGEDFEGGRTNFELSVRATDSDGLYATAQVEVAVQDVNEKPTFERDLYAFSLAENRAGPVAVGTIRATDQDAGSRLRYSLTGEAAGGFDIDDRGRVSYVGAGGDFEGGPPELSMTVMATDGGGLSGSAAITVALQDVNEVPASLAIPPVVIEVGASRELDISGHFIDPDGDELHYQAIVLGAPSVVATEIFGGLLTLVASSVGRAEVQVTAFDPGGLSATEAISVTVTISAADRERTLRRTLSAFGRTIGTEAADAIAQRLDIVDDWEGGTDIAGGSHLRLGDRSLDCAVGGCSTTAVLAQAADLIGFGEMWRTAERLAHTARSGAAAYREGSGWGRGGEALPSSPAGRLTLSALASGSSAQVAHGGLTLWARVGSGGFEGTPDEDFTVDGSSVSAFVGGDYERPGGVALGLAGSRSSASIDFESGVNGEGTVEARITGVHPYLKWSPGDIDAWATAGLGWGDADLDDQGGVLATDLRLTMGAGGVRKRFSKFLSIRADALQTTISTSDTEGIDALDAVSRRVRIAPQLSGRIDGGSTALSANVEVGMRVDGGDAETGVGAGVAGDLALAYAPLGLTLGARGRTVVAHQDSGLSDWGVGVELSARPGRRSSGLSVSVVPAWGEVASDIRRLWTEAAAKPASAKAMGHRLHPDQVRVEVGYALRTGVVHLVGERAFDPDGTPLTRLVLEGRVGL